MTDTKKLIDEIERLDNEYKSLPQNDPEEKYQLGNSLMMSAGHLFINNLDTVLAALRAVEANKADAKIMKLVRKCHKTGFVCSDPGGRFGEDDCGKCEACKLAAALASHPAPPAATCGEEGRGG